jgi:hypothetical protein
MQRVGGDLDFVEKPLPRKQRPTPLAAQAEGLAARTLSGVATLYSGQTRRSTFGYATNPPQFLPVSDEEISPLTAAAVA